MTFLKRGKLVFDKDYQSNVNITRKTFHPLYHIYSYFLKLSLQIKDGLIEEIKSKVDSKFNKAFLVLLNRSIQHTESIVLLTERGLYGDAFALYRNIISDSDMICYLHFKPELIDKFLTEGQDTYQKNTGDFKNLFSDRALRIELEKRGIKSTANIFSLFSKASHASAFGAQLYSRRANDNDDMFYLKYGPSLERERALIILFITMLIHKDFVSLILWHRREKDLDSCSSFWINISKKMDRMDKDIQKLKSLTETALDEMTNKRKKKWEL